MTKVTRLSAKRLNDANDLEPEARKQAIELAESSGRILQVDRGEQPR